MSEIKYRADFVPQNTCAWQELINAPTANRRASLSSVIFSVSLAEEGAAAVFEREDEDARRNDHSDSHPDQNFRGR